MITLNSKAKKGKVDHSIAGAKTIYRNFQNRDLKEFLLHRSYLYAWHPIILG